MANAKSQRARIAIAAILCLTSASTLLGQRFFGFRQRVATRNAQVASKPLTPRQTALDRFVVAIDDSLCLAEEQATRFRNLLQERWQPGWTELGIAESCRLAHIRDALSVIPEADLRDFLRPSQIAMLWESGGIQYEMLVEGVQAGQAWDVDEFEVQQRIHLTNIANLRIEEIQTLCHLTTDQIVLLMQEAHKCIDRMIAQQRIALKALNRGGPARLSQEEASCLSQSAAQQFYSLRNWQRVVTDVVDGRCLGKYEARELGRIALSNRAEAMATAIRRSGWHPGQ